ncbi:MAG: MATE family efflux transporter [Microcystaceae cyanobacterium]
MKKTLTQGKVSTQLLKLTLPMVWGVFAIITFNLVDTYFVGQLGTIELAAMSFTFPVVMIFGSISMGLGVGAASVISRAIGEGDRYRVQTLTTHSIILALLLVIVCAMGGMATINPLFRQLGANDEILPLIRQYMTIWYWGMICLVVPMVGTSAIRAAGNTLVPSLIMTVAAIANIALDPLFIFGFGDFAGLGLRGAAIATVISRTITLITTLWFLQYRLNLLLWKLPKKAEIINSWRNLLVIGLPATVSQMITPFSVALITRLMATYGAAAVAGFGVASRIEAFSMLGLLGLSASISPFVGQNWGAKLYDRVHQSLLLSFRWCTIWGVSVAVILAIFAPNLARLFDNDPTVSVVAVNYLRIVPISYGFSGIIFVVVSALNALGKPLPSMMINFSRMILVYVPLAYLGSYLWGIIGVFSATLIANVGVGIVAYLLIQRQTTESINEPELT